MEQAFCNQLEALSVWKRRNLPLFAMPQGAEVVTWLMRSAAHPRPLKELYAASRFSEPTVRSVVQSLADRDLVVFQYDECDQRVRLIRPSSKLVGILDEYVARIRAGAAAVCSEEAKASQSSAGLGDAVWTRKVSAPRAVSM